MTELLAQAFAEASKLSPDEQDAIAGWIISELESDKRWDTAFENSQDALLKLANEAIEEHVEGRTRPLNLDES